MTANRTLSALPDRPSLDAWRGLACLLLVAYHVVGFDPSTGLRIADGPLRVLNDGLAYLRMPLFTFLAGAAYGLRPFTGGSRAVLGGKARRLLVPMVFVGTLFALAQELVPATNSGGEAQGRNWLLLHIVPVGHFWFAEALFWIFVLVFALERARLLETPVRFAAVALVAVATDLTMPGPHWFALGGTTYLLPYFLAGVAVPRFALAPHLGQRWVRATLLVTAGVAVVALGMPVPHADRHTPWMMVAGMSLCMLSAGVRLDARWLARIGASSYAIYLFHVFFTAASRMTLGTAGVMALPMLLACGIVAGIVGPMLIERWASRYAVLRVLLLGERFRRGGSPNARALTAAG